MEWDQLVGSRFGNGSTGADGGHFGQRVVCRRMVHDRWGKDLTVHGEGLPGRSVAFNPSLRQFCYTLLAFDIWKISATGKSEPGTAERLVEFQSRGDQYRRDFQHDYILVQQPF